MGLYNCQAIVLRRFNLSETDKLVTLLTDRYGKVKVVAKAARKIKSRFGAALEPLSLIEMIYFGKENQNLYRLNQADIIRSFQPIREDYNKTFTGLYFLELIDAMIPDGHPELGAFQLLRDTLAALESNDHHHPATFV